MLSRWYRTGVIYSLDIGLFQDANGDGIGDIQGLISRLDYLARLRVTTIWLNPIHPSPRRDGGYDITEYFGVHPRFGSLGDFAILMHEAGERGIRVMLDLVVNHTSDAHPWFQAARSNPRSPFRDWYVGSQAEPPDRFEGMMFPGLENETWTHDKQAHAWYRHRFYRFEPDLTTDNPAVRVEIRKVALFWVRLGVTGFRIDEVLSQAGDVLTGPHGEASEKCRDDIDVSVWCCALVPAATTDKERVPRNGGMLWFFFATGAAIWIALWAAIRLERRLGLTPAPTRNAPAAQPADRHHRCRNMPPARRPGLCHGLTSPARPSALALPAIRNPAEAPSEKPAVLAPPPGPAAPSR